MPFQIDKSSGNRTRLLESTRRLTAGIVGGSTSHKDAFTHKFIRRALLAEQPSCRHMRLSIEDIISPLLPMEAHEAAQKRLFQIEKLKALLSLPIQLEAPSMSQASPTPKPPCKIVF